MPISFKAQGKWTLVRETIPLFAFHVECSDFGSVGKEKKWKRNLELGGPVPQHNIRGAWKQLFAVTKPTAAEMEQLNKITDALQYSCGVSLIPEDDELSSVFVVRQDVSCPDLVDKLCYSCRIFEDICCWCGVLEPEVRGDTPYNGLYGEASPERGTFFRL